MEILDTENFRHLLSERAVPLLSSLATAAAILFIGRLVVKALVSGFRRVLRRSKTDPTLENFLCDLAKAGMLTMVLLAALDHLGVNTTSFAAVIAAAGLAIGFALQSSLSNLASGVMLILFGHFRAGDLIDAAGQKGVVREVQMFWTVLISEDGTKIVCPNGLITAGVIKVLPPAAAKPATGVSSP